MDLKKIRKEAEISQYLFDKASRKKIPLSGTFELSPVCNFTCKMCYVRKTLEEVRKSERKMLTYEKWIEIARQMQANGMLYLLLTGGEPFLLPDFWKLYEELGQMGFLISINTNGSLIDEKAIERLKKNCPTRVNVTLYGASDGTYESLCGAKGMFAKVDQAITAMKEAKIPVKLNCSLTPYNICDLERIVRYADEKELLLSATTYMFPPVRRDASMVGKNERFTPEEAAYYNLKRFRLQYGEEEYFQYLERLVKGIAAPPGLEESCVDIRDGSVRCRAGTASYWVTWDGWMTPCGMMSEPKVDLVEVSAMDGFRKINELCGKMKLSGVCEKCQNHPICNACAAVAVTETGEFGGIPKYLCANIAATQKLAEEELTNTKNKKSI